ncbi:serine/threonine-protein kinase HipA [Nitrobacter vulgaris]|uniref:type II toxin-antitoxin system HipA family toxin n=1 Tax=Nitrobacter vulgaris TaxID=29421 RepID=UPI00286527B3|nr:type II toxin-antitoxin system HipA family toxin [Nitrobacter vulgaris]MDR6305181.1 serine/threonine-protein kinase HipA [Nitrobacter vulgaris]
MARRRQHAPLYVYLNNRLVGHLLKDPGGAVSFQYDESWLGWENAIPVSLSLPLREDSWRGAPVIAVFENLLPDSELLRRRVAERVGAEGADAYSLLVAIGRDCIGALQFVADGVDERSSGIEGEPIDDAAIEKLLRNLEQAPLGLSKDDDFRISVAGAQEKTALLWDGKRWRRPLGTTPTTHILKPQIGELPNGIDLSNSVENEFFCLRLLAVFGLPVNNATIETFGRTRALVIERFDRRWTQDGRLLRLPQEDCCQALSVPPSRKYQSDGGPGLVQVLDLLKGSDTPDEDRKTVLKAQILFWLIGATDGHAKNFSIFLGPGGTFRLTPLYDVLSAQPSLDARQIERKQMKLAMAVGAKNHYRIDGIQGRHFFETGRKARFSKTTVQTVINEIAATAGETLERLADELPPRFPKAIHASVSKAFAARLGVLSAET